MLFKITVETEDLEGIEAIIDRMHTLDKGDNTEKKLTVSQNDINTSIPVGPQLQPTYTTITPTQQIPVTTPQNTVTPVQQIPVATPQMQAPVQTPPTAVKQYTMQELSLAARPIVEAGRQQELLDFLHGFKKADGTPVVTIMDVPVEQYGAFANGLRQMGGKI